jgi:hypothetical protein
MGIGTPFRTLLTGQKPKTLVVEDFKGANFMQTLSRMMRLIALLTYLAAKREETVTFSEVHIRICI